MATEAQKLHAQGVAARIAEIAEDQKRARLAIEAALSDLRDRGYGSEFCRDLLLSRLHNGRACNVLDWATQTGGNGDSDIGNPSR